ncbi:MAG: GNAT family N-acetyltransferase [Acidimicrobiales bacterium]|nr:GNAT family N-acetyltransferase [Acidimicrobiales bacterium]
MTQMIERHFYQMVLELNDGPIDGPTLPPGYIVEPMEFGSLASYGRIVVRAYSGDHVDHQPEDDDPILAARVIEAALRGDELGTWMPSASAHIRYSGGPIVAAIVISDRPAGGSQPGQRDTGGPWINDVFVDPPSAGHGLGAILIVNAANQLIAEGQGWLRLAVTHGNPALGVYERLGFRIEQETRRPRPIVAPNGGCP